MQHCQQPWLGKSIDFLVCLSYYKSSPHFSGTVHGSCNFSLPGGRPKQTWGTPSPGTISFSLLCMSSFPSWRTLCAHFVPSAARTISGGDATQASQWCLSWWCLSWWYHAEALITFPSDAMKELAKSWAAFLSENSASTPSSSASCREKGCCLVRGEQHSQKDCIRITLKFNTCFLGTTWGRTFHYFWRENFGPFKSKSSHIPSPLSQHQPPWDEMEALEVVSQQLQTVTPRFRHKPSTHHSSCLWKHNCAVRFNYVIAEIILPSSWKSL